MALLASLRACITHCTSHKYCELAVISSDNPPFFFFPFFLFLLVCLVELVPFFFLLLETDETRGAD